MEKVKTILFLTPQMLVGGAERYILQKSEWLINNNYNVVIGSIGGQWENEIELLGGKHYIIDFINTDPNLFNKSTFIKNLTKLKEIIDKENITIIEANQFSPAVWGYYVSKMYNIPYLLNVLSSNIFYQGRKYYLDFIQHANSLNIYYNSECSNEIIEERRKISLENCIQIPIPVNRVEKKYNIKDDAEYILTVCRMAPDKMYIKYLLKDFYELIMDNKYENLKLVVVGDGPLFEKVNSLAVQYNKSLKRFSSEIEMKGTVVGEKLDSLFSGCLYYIGMGTTVIQAAQFGKVSILATPEKKYIKSSIGYFSEDKYNSIGFLFGLMSCESFKNRMKLLIDNPSKLKALEQNSLDIYNSHFETNRVMEKWINEYDKVIKSFTKNNNDIFQEKELFYILKKIKRYIF